MLVKVRSNKTVKHSNVNAVWSYLLGCQSTLAQEPSSSRPDGTVTIHLEINQYLEIMLIYAICLCGNSSSYTQLFIEQYYFDFNFFRLFGISVRMWKTLVTVVW